MFLSLPAFGDVVFTFDKGSTLSESDKEHLTKLIGEDGVESVESALKSGVKLTLEFYDDNSMLDWSPAGAKEPRHEPRPKPRPRPASTPNCRVKAEFDRGGSGEGHVDGKVVGGGVKGEGHSREKWDVEETR